MTTTGYQSRSVQDLRASVQAGLLGGVSIVGPGSQLDLSRAAEQSARRTQILRTAARERRAARRAGRSGRRSNGNSGGNSAAAGSGSVSRWATWLPSVPRHRSSAGAGSSSACVNC